MLLALALALASSPPNSAVPDPPLWSAPPGCPSEAEVEALLAEERGAAPRAVPDVVTTAVATPTEVGTWKVTIVVRTTEAEVRRQLELDSCEAAAEAVALVYGLALADAPASDPPPAGSAPSVPGPPARSKTAEARPLESAPDPPPDRAEEPLVPTRSEPPPTSPGRAKPSGVVHAGAGAGIGSLGQASGHVMLGTALVWPRLRWGLRIDHAIARRFRIDPGNFGGNLSALTGGFEVSVPVDIGPTQLLPTAGIRAGGARARGVGGTSARTRWVPWLVAAAGVSVVWPASRRWRLRVGAELEVPLVRHTFTFDDRFITASQPVGGLFWLGPELRLP